MAYNRLNRWLSAFVAETRNINGEPYPPKTRHVLLSGVEHHTRSTDKERAPNIFAKNDPSLQKLHHKMDPVYKELQAVGVGTQKRTTEVFTTEEENNLWESSILGVDNACYVLCFLTMANSFA